MTDYQPEEQEQTIQLFSDVINNTLISKYNISRLYVYPELNKNTIIFDLINVEMYDSEVIYLEKMFNLEHNVCLYSKFHNLGIFTPIVQLRQLAFVKNATDISNGFKPCEKIKNCCFINKAGGFLVNPGPEPSMPRLPVLGGYPASPIKYNIIYRSQGTMPSWV